MILGRDPSVSALNDRTSSRLSSSSSSRRLFLYSLFLQKRNIFHARARRLLLRVTANYIYSTFSTSIASIDAIRFYSRRWQIYPVYMRISLYFQRCSPLSRRDTTARIPFPSKGLRARYSKRYSVCTLSSHLLVSMVIRRGDASPAGRLARR